MERNLPSALHILEPDSPEKRDSINCEMMKKNGQVRPISLPSALSVPGDFISRSGKIQGSFRANGYIYSFASVRAFEMIK